MAKSTAAKRIVSARPLTSISVNDDPNGTRFTLVADNGIVPKGRDLPIGHDPSGLSNPATRGTLWLLLPNNVGKYFSVEEIETAAFPGVARSDEQRRNAKAALRTHLVQLSQIGIVSTEGAGLRTKYGFNIEESRVYLSDAAAAYAVASPASAQP